MASLYAPQLTRWREVVHGVERARVQHEGNVINVSRADCVCVGEEGDLDQRQRVQIAGRLYPLVDETEVATTSTSTRRGVARCVEYRSLVAPREASLLLTVTDSNEVEEVAAPGGDGVEELWIAGFGGCYADPVAGTVQHVVDVQGKQEAFMLIVSVNEELRRIVSIKRIN